MKKINALITKEMLLLRDFKMSFLFFTVIFAIIAVMFNLTQYLGLMVGLALAMTVTFSFTIDEMQNTDRFMVCLPVSRKDIVLSKFVMSLITSLAGTIVGCIVSIIILIIKDGSTGAEPMRWVGMVLVDVLMVGIMNCIQIPSTMKSGALKSRSNCFIVIGIIILFFVLIKNFGDSLGVVLPMDMLEKIWNRFWLLILIGITALEYLVSYQLAKKFYLAKDI